MCSPAHRESGQAAVEAALTLPLLVFLVLGTTQLFLMLQARQMAQYAAFWAAREGSVTQGNCKDMAQITMRALLPTFTRLRGKSDVAAEAQRRERADRYFFDSSRETGFSGDVFWLHRTAPASSDVVASLEERFDQGGPPMRLEVELIYWYPMRIPFANWVMAQMFRAVFGLQEYHSANPIFVAKADANWTDGKARFSDAAVREAFDARTSAGEYVFPITTRSAMRFMTPPVPANFRSQHCITAP